MQKSNHSTSAAVFFINFFINLHWLGGLGVSRWGGGWWEERDHDDFCWRRQRGSGTLTSPGCLVLSGLDKSKTTPEYQMSLNFLANTLEPTAISGLQEQVHILLDQWSPQTFLNRGDIGKLAKVVHGNQSDSHRNWSDTWSSMLLLVLFAQTPYCLPSLEHTHAHTHILAHSLIYTHTHALTYIQTHTLSLCAVFCLFVVVFNYIFKFLFLRTGQTKCVCVRVGYACLYAGWMRLDRGVRVRFHSRSRSHAVIGQ